AGPAQLDQLALDVGIIEGRAAADDALDVHPILGAVEGQLEEDNVLRGEEGELLALRSVGDGDGAIADLLVARFEGEEDVEMDPMPGSSEPHAGNRQGWDVSRFRNEADRPEHGEHL